MNKKKESSQVVSKKRLDYQCPELYADIYSIGMNLFAGFSLGGDFEEALLDGGDANYEGLDEFDFS